MSPLEAVAILLAGVAAGGINSVVGSGTLITFPTLLAIGFPPVVANVSNNIGLVPGSVSGVFGYRRELAGQGRRAARLASASLLGGLAGAGLLLVLPEDAFSAIVPVLIGLGVLLVVVQPRLSARVAERRRAEAEVPADGGAPVVPDRWWVWPATLATGVYGGYFGAAQGVLLLGVLGIGVHESLQRLNAVKNVLAATVNAVAGLVFVFLADVDWRVAGLIGAGSVVGGLVGSAFGRRLPSYVLRAVIVVVGLVAMAVIVLG